MNAWIGVSRWHLNRTGLIFASCPHCSSVEMRLCQKQLLDLKAQLKTLFPESIAKKMSLKTLKRADLVLWCVLNPDWNISRCKQYLLWQLGGRQSRRVKVSSTKETRPSANKRGKRQEWLWVSLVLKV